MKYNKAERTKEALNQFKKLLKEVYNEKKNRDETVRNMPMVDTNTIEGYKLINGLTPQENRELNSVLKYKIKHILKNNVILKTQHMSQYKIKLLLKL